MILPPVCHTAVMYSTMATNRKKRVLVWDISHLVEEIDCFGKCSIGKGVLGRDIVDNTFESYIGSIGKCVLNRYNISHLICRSNIFYFPFLYY